MSAEYSDDFEDDDGPVAPAGPYASGADRLYAAKWRGIIPVTGKWPPVTGWTGRDGEWPSYPDIQAFKDTMGDHNIGLRLPDGVIGVDVDHYGDKRGGDTLAEREAEWGELPATWITTSRSDGISGIRLFRTPTGLAWPGKLPGADVELVLWSFRYCMVAPSIHPKTGDEYFWKDPNGVRSIHPPQVGDLPLLPVGWIIGLSQGQFAAVPRAEVKAQGWLAGLPGASQHVCDRMAAVALDVLQSLTSGARHDALLDGSMKVIRAAEQGHAGALAALGALRGRFAELVIGDGSRTAGEADGEWVRAVDGAVSRVAATPTRRMSSGDPCAPEPLSRAPLAAPLSIAPLPVAQPAGEQLAAAVLGADLGELGEDDRTSWWPQPWGPFLRGEEADEMPTVLARSDGELLLYPGRVNGFIGPSESGKSWLALEAARQVAGSGKKVILLDFEDKLSGAGARLRSLGIADDVIASHFLYIHPEDPLEGQAKTELELVVSTFAPYLIILDGVNAAMDVLGLDPMSNADATRFYRMVLAPLAASGAVVVYVDHTPKNDTERVSAGGIGAQAKRAMTTGSTIRAQVKVPFGRGLTGILELTVDKDRQGQVRGIAAKANVIGTATVVSDPNSDSVAISIDPVSDEDIDEQGRAKRPTTLMDRVEHYLQMQVEPVSLREIRDNITGSNTGIATAVRVLVDEDRAVKTSGRNGGARYSIPETGSLVLTGSGLVHEPAERLVPEAIRTTSWAEEPVKRGAEDGRVVPDLFDGLGDGTQA